MRRQTQRPGAPQTKSGMRLTRDKAMAVGEPMPKAAHSAMIAALLHAPGAGNEQSPPP